MKAKNCKNDKNGEIGSENEDIERVQNMVGSNMFQEVLVATRRNEEVLQPLEEAETDELKHKRATSASPRQPSPKTTASCKIEALRATTLSARTPTRLYLSLQQISTAISAR